MIWALVFIATINTGTWKYPSYEHRVVHVELYSTRDRCEQSRQSANTKDKDLIAQCAPVSKVQEPAK